MGDSEKFDAKDLMLMHLEVAKNLKVVSSDTTRMFFGFKVY